MRIQKYLSQSWVCSRRKAEEFIKKWFVKINWRIAKIWESMKIWEDKIELLDKAIKEQQNFVYYKLNKPRWIITTCATNGEKNIVDILDIKERVFPIWRLDKDTSWLILFTNDWRLANFLMHPKYNHKKEYIVEVFGSINDKQLDKIKKWIFIDGRMTKDAIVDRIWSWRFKIIITEWRNRQIRRLVRRVWLSVKRLKRIRIENIKLDNLNYWEYKKLSNIEKNILFKKMKKI